MKTLSQFLGVLLVPFALASVTACQTTDLVTYVVGASPDASAGGDADPPDGNAGDGASDGGAIADDGGPFGCLALPPSTLGTSAVTVQLVVTNWQDLSKTAGQIDGGSDLIDVVYTPLPGVAATACDLVDAGDEAGCASPAAATATSDDAGLLSFPLSGAFTGFYRLTGPDLVPTSFFPGPMPAGVNAAEFFPAPLLTYEYEQLLSTALGIPVDLDAGAGLGEVFLSVYDCNDHSLAGVTFSFSGDAGAQVPLYLAAGIPNTTKTVTDKEGMGGAVNVPAGSQTITATYVGVDPYEPMSTTLGTLDVFVRPGEVTIGYVRMRALHQGP